MNWRRTLEQVILSLDPGGTTGYTLIEVSENTELEILRVGQIKNSLKGFLDFHWDVLEDWKIDKIICESFTLREGIYGADLSPVYIIGALEALYPTTEIIYQEPKLKPLCDNDRLKKLGLYIPGKEHAMDAVRHGVIHLRNSKHMPTLEKGWR
jgi:hypothetical protein